MTDALSDSILDVRKLVTTVDAEVERLRAVDGIRFSVDQGMLLGIVGESG